MERAEGRKSEPRDGIANLHLGGRPGGAYGEEFGENTADEAPNGGCKKGREPGKALTKSDWLEAEKGPERLRRVILRGKGAVVSGKLDKDVGVG